MARPTVDPEHSKEAGAFRVGMTPAERAEVDEAARLEGKTRSAYAREAVLAHVRRQPLSHAFLRGLYKRAPTNTEVELLELAWLARNSRMPEVKAGAQEQLEELIRHVQATAAKLEG